MLTKQCGPNDFEKWYARPEGRECLMGHKVSKSPRLEGIREGGSREGEGEQLI